MASRTDKIAVAGAGRMGRGIAISFAWAGYPVALLDSEERTPDAFADLAASTRDELAREARSLADAGVMSRSQADDVSGRIDLIARADSEPILSGADIVFEAVAEVVDIKRETYAWLGEVARDDTILASTTSTMLADTLAGFVAGPDRFSNAHWLNPAYLMPLVEVSPAAQTRGDVVDSLVELLEQIGKVPVVCRASPGYIVSRIQALVLNEAARLVEEGVASAEDVDRAVRTGLGTRYAIFGPLEFIDWGGGDILYFASNYLGEMIDATSFSPPGIVRRNMDEGRNGMREGIGFYDWRNRDLEAYRTERLAEFAGLLGHLGLLTRRAETTHAE